MRGSPGRFSGTPSEGRWLEWLERLGRLERLERLERLGRLERRGWSGWGGWNGWSGWGGSSGGAAGRLERLERCGAGDTPRIGAGGGIVHEIGCIRMGDDRRDSVLEQVLSATTFQIARR